jgi:hypothetical protein
LLLLLTAALLIVPAGDVRASDDTPRDDPVDEPTDIEKAIEEVTHPFPEDEPLSEVERPAGEPGVDECDWTLEGQPVQEQSQEVVRSWSCHTFRWFDSWWGDEEDFREDEVNGWITAGTSYRDYDGLDPRLRLRVHAPLPNLDKRWDIMLGRFDEDAYLSDTESQDRTFYNQGVVGRDDDAQWLLGLGKKRRNKRQGWDWSAGVRLRLPPRPYVKLSYFWNRQPSEDTDLRLRQTFFWNSDKGFGTTSRGDYSWGINASDVMRWEAVGTVHEESEGTRWFLGQTWYHLFGEHGSFAFLVFGKGETSHEVGLHDAGFNFTWRRPFTREWMYLSMGPSLTWPREKREEDRELNVGFGLWLEIEFGAWRY